MSRNNSERISGLESTMTHILKAVTELRDALLGGEQGGVTTRVTRCEERIGNIVPRVEKLETKVDHLLVKAAGFSGLATIVMLFIGELAKKNLF